MKRQATIPDPVLMTALKASSGIAEHQSARHECRPPIRSPVLERASRDGGHAYQMVLLFERPVMGPRRANNVLDPPTWTRRQQMHAHGHDIILAIFPKRQPEPSS